MEYISIIGTGVTGSLGGLGRAAAAKVAASIDVVAAKDESAAKKSASLGDRFQSLVAFSSYSVLCGEGENVLGDGKYDYQQNVLYCHTHGCHIPKIRA